MTIKELNPYVWFGTRKLSTVPSHFVQCPTPATSESTQWVITNLKGRYATATTQKNPFELDSTNTYFFFEDPREATIYELRWAGGK